LPEAVDVPPSSPHVASVQKLKVTDPSGVPFPVPPPVFATVPLACTVEPSATALTPVAATSVAGLPSWISVVRLVLSGTMSL
jgi:hypothetical protein